MDAVLSLFDIRSFLLFILIFVPLEHLLPIHEKARMFRRGVLPDILHFFFSGIFIRIGLFLVILGSIGAGSALIPQGFSQTIGSLPLWLQVLLATIIADLGFYLSHRMMHSIPFLWRFHAVHHSSEELDWLASYRVHPVDQVIVKGASLIPIFMLGFSEAAIAIASIIYQWQALFLHSNVKISFGPLNWLFASPEFHHWHHANQVEAYDKNFAGQLSAWDWVFGTAHVPGKMPEKYGVDDQVPEDYIGQMVFPFVPEKQALQSQEDEAKAS